MNFAQALRMLRLLERDLQAIQDAVDADDFKEIERQVKKFDVRHRLYLASGGWKNDHYYSLIQNYRKAGSRVLERVTARQMGYLRSFGYDGDSTNLTRKEAGRLIDGIKEMLARDQATTAILAQLQRHGAVSPQDLAAYGEHRVQSILEELGIGGTP